MSTLISYSKTLKKRRLVSSIVHNITFIAASASTIAVVIILATLLNESLQFFEKVNILEYLTGTQWAVLFEEKKFGVLPLLNATLLSSLIALGLAVPIGLAIAIYLGEYASNRVKNIFKPMIELLAGIPTVVYGYFALYFVTPQLLRLFLPDIQINNILAAGLMIGFLIIPIVASISEDAIRSVPLDLRLAAYAVGARKFEVVLKIVIPAALSGIFASIILAFGRAMGETMIVAIAAGFRPILSYNVKESMETMTGFIAQVATGDAPYGTIEYSSLFAVGLTLLLMTYPLNLIALRVLKRWAIRY
jgi:phosphate transport system permease protein